MDPGTDWSVRWYADVSVLGNKRTMPILRTRRTLPARATKVRPIAHEMREHEMSVDSVLNKEVQQRDSIAVLVVGIGPVSLDCHSEITLSNLKNSTNPAAALFRLRAAT